MIDANIAETLSEQAKSHPYQMAVAFPHARDGSGRACYSQLTYAQLEASANRIARGLLMHGIGEGMRTAFMVKPSLEFFILTFALFKAKAIPVLIDPGLGVKPIKRCLTEAQAEAFMGIPLAHLARVLFRWKGRHGLWKKRVVIGGSSRAAQIFGRVFGSINYQDLWEAGGRPSAPELPLASPDETAAVLFTSGSTGAPKAALYTHGNFRAQIDLLAAALQIKQGEIDLCTFPLFALFAPALGMSAVVPEMDFTRPGEVDPEKIREAIETFGVNNMFGSPALIRRVASYGAAQRWHFPSLRRVIAAGAPVPAATIEGFRALLDPRCDFFTPYGATESLPVALAESRMLLGETRFVTDAGGGICVGFPASATDVKIIRISDEPIRELQASDLLSPGEIGEIIVAGPQVTRRYDQREDANRLAKIMAPAGEEFSFYHRMGDLGYRDAAGRLWFCGRKSQRVITPSAELFTINCEAIFNQHPSVARTALVGIGEAPLQTPAICVELKNNNLSPEAQKRLFAELRERALSFPHTAGIEYFYLHLHSPFPVDIRHNAKIFREKLKPWAEAQWQKEKRSGRASASSSPVAAASLARHS